MHSPAATSTPSRWRISRRSASWSLSPSSTRPPGNSHMSGKTALGRRWVMRYFPSRAITAATTRMRGRSTSAPRRRDLEQLLAHQQDLAGRELCLAADAHEGAVGAAEIGEEHAAALEAEPAVQARHVAVVAEQHLAALAPDVQA